MKVKVKVKVACFLKVKQEMTAGRGCQNHVIVPRLFCPISVDRFWEINPDIHTFIYSRQTNELCYFQLSLLNSGLITCRSINIAFSANLTFCLHVIIRQLNN